MGGFTLSVHYVVWLMFCCCVGDFCLFGFVCAFVCFLKTDLGQTNKYLPTAFYIFLQRRLYFLKVNEEEAWNYPVCVNKAFTIAKV